MHIFAHLDKQEESLASFLPFGTVWEEFAPVAAVPPTLGTCEDI